VFSSDLLASHRLANFHIQPIIDLRSNLICGGELLWRPDDKVPSREAFEALDEDPSLNLLISQQAFLTALQLLDSSQSSTWLSVNLSCRFVLSSQTFFRAISEVVDDLDGLRRRVGKRLVIEVVEKSVAGPSERKFINELSQLHSIAVDDFGVGQAPVSHMLSFNYNKVKIDRSVVSNCDSDLYRQRFLHWVCGGCKAIGVEICAEGVETESEAAYLRRLGIEQGQGWLWSKAVEPDTFHALCNPEGSTADMIREQFRKLERIPLKRSRPLGWRRAVNRKLLATRMAQGGVNG